MGGEKKWQSSGSGNKFIRWAALVVPVCTVYLRTDAGRREEGTTESVSCHASRQENNISMTKTTGKRPPKDGG